MYWIYTDAKERLPFIVILVAYVLFLLSFPADTDRNGIKQINRIELLE